MYKYIVKVSLAFSLLLYGFFFMDIDQARQSFVSPGAPYLLKLEQLVTTDR